MVGDELRGWWTGVCVVGECGRVGRSERGSDGYSVQGRNIGGLVADKRAAPGE